MEKQIKATKAQRDMLYNCHLGVGYLMYKSAKDTITQTEFYLVKGVPCYLTTGKPVEFNVFDIEDDSE